MADILTGGRVIFRVARGYHTREVETFGAPLLDQEVNRELFEEGVDILFKEFEGNRSRRRRGNRSHVTETVMISDDPRRTYSPRLLRSNHRPGANGEGSGWTVGKGSRRPGADAVGLSINCRGVGGCSPY